MIHTAPGATSTATNFVSPASVRAFVGGARGRAWLSLKLGVAVLCLWSGCYFAWTIAPAALGTRAPTVEQGLFPEWFGTREVLHGRNPYRPEVTGHIQATLYGAMPDHNRGNEQRFAYPLYSTLLFLPLAVLPFAAAEWLALAACLALTVLSVWMWASGGGLKPSTLTMATIGMLSTYPALLGLQLRQPSLVIAGLLAVVVYWARSGRLVWAGMLGALCTAKPQLAIAVLLPMSVWSVVRWHSRKRFLIALGGSLCVLLLASEIAVPGWFRAWLATLAAYSHYAGSLPLLADLLHGHFVWPAGALLVGASLLVSYRFCEADLLFAISFSVAVFQLFFPFLLYNEVLLLPATLWLLQSSTAAKSSGQIFKLFRGTSWVFLGTAAVSMFALALANLFAPGSGLKLWQIPFTMVWLYPWSVLLALAAYAFPPLVGCDGVKPQL